MRTAYRTDGPEAFRPVGETELVAAVPAESERTADEGSVIAGIVGFADLRVPEVADVLAAHVDAGGGRFRGIRHASAYDPNPEIRRSHAKPPRLFADPAFRSGLAALGRAGLGYDAWLYHPQLPELVELARALPDVPRWPSAPTSRWSSAASACRSPGAAGTTAPSRRPPRSWRTPGAPRSAGVSRRSAPTGACSSRNFPVDERSCGYDALWDAFALMVADASDGDRADLFGGTATRVYRRD